MIPALLQGQGSMQYPEKPQPRTALYVDLENLGGNIYALSFLESLLGDWKLDVPQPHFLYLYTRADQRSIWEMWAIDHFPEKYLTVRGVQHVSNLSKNSADIALVMDAALDFQADRAQNIVVVSDDSDFTALFDKIRELHTARQKGESGIPFRWVMTDRRNTTSTALTDLFHNSFIHIIGMPPDDSEASPIVPDVISAAAEPNYQDLATTISAHFGSGARFKSTDCMKFISDSWPNHHSATMKGPAFGTWFKKNVAPELKKLGVREIGKTPLRYQIPAKPGG